MEEDNEEYICLINEEEQYSLWFAWKKIPLGWKQVGPKGPKQVFSTDTCHKSLKKVIYTWLNHLFIK